MFAVKIKEEINDVLYVQTKSLLEVVEQRVTLNSGTFMYVQDIDYHEDGHSKTVDLHLKNNIVVFSIPEEKLLIQDKDEIDIKLSQQMDTETHKKSTLNAQANLSTNNSSITQSSKKRGGCGCSKKKEQD